MWPREAEQISRIAKDGKEPTLSCRSRAWSGGERGLRSEGCRRRASRSPPLHEPGKRREARARAPSREAPPRPQTQGQRGNARRRKGKLREKRGEPAPARPPGEDGRLRRATRERTALGAPGADAGVSTAPWKGRAGEAETPGRGEGEGGKQEERRALAGWDGRPDGERCRKTQRRERRREETVPRPRGALGRPGPPARPWETSGRGDLGTEGGRVTQRPRGAETVGRAARLQSRFFAQTNKY